MHLNDINDTESDTDSRGSDDDGTGSSVSATTKTIQQQKNTAFKASYERISM